MLDTTYPHIVLCNIVKRTIKRGTKKMNEKQKIEHLRELHYQHMVDDNASEVEEEEVDFDEEMGSMFRKVDNASQLLNGAIDNVIKLKTVAVRTEELEEIEDELYQLHGRVCNLYKKLWQTKVVAK